MPVKEVVLAANFPEINLRIVLRRKDARHLGAVLFEHALQIAINLFHDPVDVWTKLFVPINFDRLLGAPNPVCLPHKVVEVVWQPILQQIDGIGYGIVSGSQRAPSARFQLSAFVP